MIRIFVLHSHARCKCCGLTARILKVQPGFWTALIIIIIISVFCLLWGDAPNSKRESVFSNSSLQCRISSGPRVSCDTRRCSHVLKTNPRFLNAPYSIGYRQYCVWVWGFVCGRVLFDYRPRVAFFRVTHVPNEVFPYSENLSLFSVLHYSVIMWWPESFAPYPLFFFSLSLSLAGNLEWLPSESDARMLRARARVYTRDGSGDSILLFERTLTDETTMPQLYMIGFFLRGWPGRGGGAIATRGKEA